MCVRIDEVSRARLHLRREIPVATKGDVSPLADGTTSQRHRHQRGGHCDLLDQRGTIELRTARPRFELHTVRREHRLGVVDRHREADARRNIGHQLGEIYTDHFAALIDQRAAAVAGIDPRVDLQHFLALVRVDPRDRAARLLHVVAENARQREADRPDFFAQFHSVRIGERQRRQTGRRDADQRDVTHFVSIKNRRFVSLPANRDFDFARSFHDVLTRHQVAVGMNDERGAGPLTLFVRLQFRPTVRVDAGVTEVA